MSGHKVFKQLLMLSFLSNGMDFAQPALAQSKLNMSEPKMDQQISMEKDIHPFFKTERAAKLLQKVTDSFKNRTPLTNPIAKITTPETQQERQEHLAKGGKAYWQEMNQFEDVKGMDSEARVYDFKSLVKQAEENDIREIGYQREYPDNPDQKAKYTIQVSDIKELQKNFERIAAIRNTGPSTMYLSAPLEGYYEEVNAEIDIRTPKNDESSVTLSRDLLTRVDVDGGTGMIAHENEGHANKTNLDLMFIQEQELKADSVAIAMGEGDNFVKLLHQVSEKDEPTQIMNKSEYDHPSNLARIYFAEILEETKNDITNNPVTANDMMNYIRSTPLYPMK